LSTSIVNHSVVTATQIVGIILAIVSGVLIGCSFVLKKKGLLRSQAGHTAGEGVGYLKSVRLQLFSFSLFGIRTFKLRHLTSHYGGLA
jgi:hypothetical protein